MMKTPTPRKWVSAFVHGAKQSWPIPRTPYLKVGNRVAWTEAAKPLPEGRVVKSDKENFTVKWDDGDTAQFTHGHPSIVKVPT
jgi:hypothetical protein